MNAGAVASRMADSSLFIRIIVYWVLFVSLFANLAKLIRNSRLRGIYKKAKALKIV
jgi:hypothetical protein